MQEEFLNKSTDDVQVVVRVVLLGAGIINQTVIDTMIDTVNPPTLIQNETTGLPLDFRYRLELQLATALLLDGGPTPEMTTPLQTVYFGKFMGTLPNRKLYLILRDSFSL